MSTTHANTVAVEAGRKSPAGVHRMVTAAGLVVSAALVAASGVVTPPNSGGAAELYQVATESSGRLTTGAVLLAISSIPLVFGVLGAARLVTRRGRFVARAAAVLGVMGALGHMGYSTFTVLLPRITGGAASRADAVAIIEEINGSVAVGALIAPLILGYALSVLLLPIALYRARFVPLWVVALVAGAVAIEAANAGTGGLGVLKYLLTLAAYAVIGYRIARMSDDQWRTGVGK